MSPTNYIFSCSKCRTFYSVSATDPDLRLLEREVSCPNFPCKGKIVPFVQTNAKMKAVKVKAVELFQSHQMGLGEERKCGPKTLRKLLTGATIKDLDIDKGTGPDRSIIRSITLVGGKTIHLGPSTHGVVVLKVTENRDGR